MFNLMSNFSGSLHSLHTLIIYYIQNGARQNILLMSFASSPSKNKTSSTG